MNDPPNEALSSRCANGCTARRLIDVTMFWSGGPGGVARYLQSKGEWLRRRSDWSQTIFVPGPESHSDRVRSPRLPFSGGYRLPWRRRAAARQLVALAPDLIEAGDPYRLAWSAIDASDRTGARLAAFCHSDVEQAAADAGGRAARLITRRYLLHVYRHLDPGFGNHRCPDRFNSRRCRRAARDVRLGRAVGCGVRSDLSVSGRSTRSSDGFSSACLVDPGEFRRLKAIIRVPPFTLLTLADATFE